jgi:hypothetical protein
MNYDNNSPFVIQVLLDYPLGISILFEKDEKFFIGYLVKYIGLNLNGKLEFVLRNKTGILDLKFGNSKIKKLLKRFLTYYMIMYQMILLCMFS